MKMLEILKKPHHVREKNNITEASIAAKSPSINVTAANVQSLLRAG